MTAPLESELQGPSFRRRLFSSGFGFLIVLVAVMWVVEAVDSVLLDDRLQGNGIVPRREEALDGVLWAPFLHVGWDHLIANSVPLLVLGGLVSVWGRRRWFLVTLLVVLVGGVATWALARSGNHIGASGLVFGYFGFLIGAVFFERRFWPIVPATIAVLSYGGAILGGVVPTDGVSWEGHVFGGLAGVVAARISGSRSRSPDAPDLVP